MKTATLIQKIHRATPEEQKLIAQILDAPEPLQHSLSEALCEVKKKKSINPLLKAAIELVVKVGRDVVLPAQMTQKSPLEMLIQVLTMKEALDGLAPVDPLAAARLKGVQVKKDLLYQTGQPLTSEEAARLLGLTRQAVDKRRRKGQLLGISLGKRGYLYPLWQFQEGKVLSGLEPVLAALSKYDPWTQLMFLMTGDIRLGGSTPLERLQAGDLESVVWAASCYGKQIAA